MLGWFYFLFLLIEFISLVIQIKELKDNNRTANVVVIIINITKQ